MGLNTDTAKRPRGKDKTGRDKEREYIRMGRHLARTDILWLCHNILGMKKVNKRVHGPMIERLQQFDKQGTDEWNEEEGRFVYTPPASDPAEVYRGEDEVRRRLLLAPRGWYKTSVNVVAHTIQWILNFPDITMLLMHASQETIEKMLVLIKYHFHKNKVMRYFFPEFCPPINAKEFGTQTWFNSPARKKMTASPTVMIAGIESVRTGMHFHVMKFTDIVDEKNSSTKEQCEKIIYAYSMCENLLISPLYWIDVEGTRYNFSDLYGRIIDQWIDYYKVGKKHEFQVFLMGCYHRDIGKVGKTVEEFTPDEVEAPFAKGEDGLPISRFPEEFPTEALERKRHDPVYGEYLFSCQQLNHPIASEDADFTLEMIKWKAPKDIERIQKMYYLVTVDLGETQNVRSDPTVITVAAVDRMNRKYIVEIQRGKYKPDEIVERIFKVYEKYRPYKIKIEETGFLRGLMNSIQRKSQMSGLYPNFEFLKRETQVSKMARIKLTLQPMMKEGLIYFSTGLEEDVKTQLKFELVRFPRYIHDDILDTLADLYQNELVSGPLKPSPRMEEVLQRAERILFERADLFNELYGPEKENWSSWDGLGGL